MPACESIRLGRSGGSVHIFRVVVAAAQHNPLGLCHADSFRKNGWGRGGRQRRRETSALLDGRNNMPAGRDKSTKKGRAGVGPSLPAFHKPGGVCVACTDLASAVLGRARSAPAPVGAAYDTPAFILQQYSRLYP